MDVEHPPVVARDERGRQDAHEAGQHDEVGRVRVDGVGQRRVEGRAIGERPVVEHAGRDAGILRDRQPAGVGAVAEDGDDPARPLLGQGRAHDRVQVRALTRNQDHYSFHGRQV